MKVYTYYDQIPGLPCQTDLIDLWKKFWPSRGYEPVVLNDSDARKHPRYEQFCSYITELHKEIKQVSIQIRNLPDLERKISSCFFVTQKPQSFL